MIFFILIFSWIKPLKKTLGVQHSPWHFGVDQDQDPDPRIHASDPAIFVIDLQDASKKLIFYTIFSAYYFLKLHLHHFSEIKSLKESQNSRNQVFSYYFWMMIGGSGSGSRAGSGSIPLTSGSGSGSGRPKNVWIRWIRIRNTDENFSDWSFFPFAISVNDTGGAPWAVNFTANFQKKFETALMV